MSSPPRDLRVTESAASSNIITDQRQPGRRKQRHPRKPTSCEPCRLSKLRCDRQIPCAACRRRDNIRSCKYHSNGATSPTRIPPQETAATIDSSLDTRPKTATASSNQSLTQKDRSNGFEAGKAERESQDFTRTSWESLWQRPAMQSTMPAGQTYFPTISKSKSTCDDFQALLPPLDCCDYLVIQYFTFMAPMFHILHEATFQRHYSSFKQDLKTNDLSWLALLFSILSLSVQTLENSDPILAKIRERIPCSDGSAAVALELRQIATMCLVGDNFMFHYSLSTLESLLILTYGISHDVGVDAAWTLLGLVLNMAIALKCNVSSDLQAVGDVDTERRRRCWVCTLSLHTYQAILFRDIDAMSLLGGTLTKMADNSDVSTHLPMGPQVMSFKLRLFHLSSRICHKSLNHTGFEESTISALDTEVAKEQTTWDTAFLQDGSPSVLDASSYAHWSLLQVHAQQLYLLLHRPFCRARVSDGTNACTSPYRQSSRRKCITSGAALLDIQRRYIEAPRLRHHRWTVNGMIGSCAVHGAMALASCLLEEHDDGLDVTPYRKDFDAFVDRIGMLQSHSTIYIKAYPILRHIQTIFRSQQRDARSTILGVSGDLGFGESFDNWMSTIEWFDPHSINWDFWDDIVGVTTSQQIINEQINSSFVA